MKSGRVALITGASRGIGKAIALQLARDGFTVIINYHHKDKDLHDTEQGLKDIEASYCLIKADVTRGKDVHRIFKIVKKRFGIIDVVVNNAGLNQTKSFVKLKPDDIDKIINTNLTSVFKITAMAVPLMRLSRSPRIIFISSLNSFVGSINRSVYASSKSGLIGLSRSLAQELAPKFLVNTVVPGYIDTPMLKKFSQEPLSKKVEKIPLRRFGTPKEVAELIAFLASDKSSYITGQCIHINGGVYSN